MMIYLCFCCCVYSIAIRDLKPPALGFLGDPLASKKGLLTPDVAGFPHADSVSRIVDLIGL